MPNKYNYDKWITKKELEELYLKENLTQSEIANKFNCSLRKVQQTMKRFEIKSKRQVKRNQFRENNDSWKGIKAGYKALHYRVYNLLGNPKNCDVCGTEKAKRYEWANLTRDYANPKDYKRMCVRCHRQFDKEAYNRDGKGRFK